MSERPIKRKRLSAGAKPTSAATSTISDPRFANIQSDPRYRLPGKKHRVKLDSRFSQALKDDDFSRRAKVDRYGRPLETDAERKRLKRKYEFEEDGSGEESDGADDDAEVQKELRKVGKARDVLREGKTADSSSSSSSSDEDSGSELDEVEEAELAPQTQSKVPTGEVSSRLAVVNLDWDNIRAQDLMAVFSSFLDPGGQLQHVAIYPSEFGKERLQREEMEGPPAEIFATSKMQHDEVSDVSEDAEDDEEAIKSDLLKPEDAEDFNSQALRQYQIERLRYFYAILAFSSPSAAKAIYDTVDGTEYLSTANFFDLRFVPDDTDFSNDTPRDECSSTPSDYKPNAFVTDALQHSKVKLTWDAEDTSRKEAVARAFRGGRKDIEENDLKAYLGSDSSSSESEAEEALHNNGDASTTTMSKKESSRAKMRALLGLAPEPASKVSSKDKKDKAPVGNVQITFSAGLSGNNVDEDGKKRSVFVNTEEEANETTIERYRRKERERKTKRKERAKGGRSGQEAVEADSDDEQQQPNTAKDTIAPDRDGDDLGFDDPFFVEPEADTSKAASKKLRKEERLKKKQEREAEEKQEQKQRAELELLMADDGNEGGVDGGGKQGVRHFDMREIERAEKAARKKDRKKKNKDQIKSAHTATDEGHEFKVDASDPRFAGRLFENHEFAIDPSNPKYKETRAMKELLEEGRRRKKDKATGKGDKDFGGGGARVEGDLKTLVEKLKKS